MVEEDDEKVKEFIIENEALAKVGTFFPLDFPGTLTYRSFCFSLLISLHMQILE